MSTKTSIRRRKDAFWRNILVIAALLLVAACIIGVLVTRTMFVGGAESGQIANQIVEVEQRSLIETVDINGMLEPRDQARIRFQEDAQVREVLVAAGDAVISGTVLARLETRDLQLQVASAQAELDAAQQALDQLLEGPDAAELARAEAGVAAARAALLAAAQAVEPADVALAEEALRLARAELAALEQGELPPELRAAQNALINAENALTDSQVAMEQTRDAASRAKTSAQQAMERGAQAVELAQRAYSDAFWDWDYVQKTGRHPRDRIPAADGSERRVNRELEDHEIEAFRRAFLDAETALGNAQVELKNLVEAYEQAREDEIRQIQEAERAVAEAERNLAEARRDYEQIETRGMSQALLEARRRVQEADKAYRSLVDDPEQAAQLSNLEASLLQATANLEELQAGADPVDVARARTTLEQARAGLASAEADLDEATLRAPISGTVVDLTLKAGTRTSADDAIRIADLSGFVIRGEVTEQDIIRVAVGQQVQVSIDSVPEETFSGRVTRVSELPLESESGGMGPGMGGGGALGGRYPIEILIENSDPRLRVGMATTASIVILEVPEALVIPLQAVQSGPDGPRVQRVSGPASAEGETPGESISVELGARSGDMVQVLSGLEAGDRLIVPQLPPPEMPGP